MTSGTEKDNPLHMSWSDSAWIPHLNQGNVMDYFSERSNPFYDRSCNNEVVKMQRRSPEHLKSMTGVEYELIHAQQPILFVIRKQRRHSPEQVTPLTFYYIIAGVIYQAPDLASIINSRLLTSVYNIQSAFEEVQNFSRYHPSKGYWWEFKDQEKEKDSLSAKPKEEISSLFQRQRVDVLLAELTRSFPPKVYQPKPGDKPIPVSRSDPSGAIKEEVKEEINQSQNNANSSIPGNVQTGSSFLAANVVGQGIMKPPQAKRRKGK
ncbi:mediator of RNA polymerase II transcription subunit 6-like isoform X1 [Apostichopus japonicus]|uniref:mediator of RNA polymerase II transcription subunit 6-like isoform X1 n=2 Tax=Stichopus japonicus TaxID=307972 RepID=UPI003AB540FD